MSKLTKRETIQAEFVDNPDEGPAVGQWYWVKYEGHPDWLGSVVHIGSNYVKVEGVEGYVRVHLDEFDQECRREPAPDEYIEGRIGHFRDEVGRLMGKVTELTARLGVAPSPELTAGSETRALATVNSTSNMGEYKSALVKAKKDTLPDLFKEIERANESMAKWMTAKVIPLKAQAEGMKGSIKTIEERIFNVELYAGLTEQVVRIADGEPAEMGAKIHLYQRRCYMDEECLADYQAGGMDFQGIEGFDEWIARPVNRDRVLPFERCLVAFRVRRNEKHREVVNLRDFINFAKMGEADKWTFMYIRNGERIYRMNTGVEFGPKLFPDLERSKLDGHKLWAKKFGSRIDKLITDDEYQGMREDEDREHAEWKAKMAEKKAAKAAGKEVRPGGPWDWEPRRQTDEFSAFNQDNVYYDDIVNKIQEDIKEHNRIALILQGLLDRSPVMHPHPPWQIWTNEGFAAALELVYDDDRVLTAGEKPDFEAYRAKLNASLKAGSITVGQDDAWELAEAEKESRRLDNDYRSRSEYRPERYRPDGNDGPGMVSRVGKFGKRSRKASFAWERERRDWNRQDEGTIRATFSCHESQLLNVDAYKPGDFRQFFNDPRTRAEYLKWAPVLLEAEEYHAGNREAQAYAPAKPKTGSTWEGRKQYQQRKRKKAMMGCGVRLVREISLQGGETCPKGSLWRVVNGTGRVFTLASIKEDGEYAGPDGFGMIRQIEYDDFEVDPSIAQHVEC